MKPLSRRRLKFLKSLALLSQIRWYNILMLVTGQYLAALFVFAPEGDKLSTLFDTNTHLVIWSGALVLSFGFLINSFYDLESDSINRPQQTAFERLVSKRTSLRIALTLLLIAMVMAVTVSYRAFLFYGLYAFALWLHSHKLKTIPIVSHSSAAILALVPFFGISVYQQYLSIHTFAFGALLGLTLFSRELLKDLMMFKGDVLVGRSTVASEYGLGQTRFALLIGNSVAWIPAFFTRDLFSDIAEKGIFLILVMLTLSNLATLRTNELKDLKWAHLGYKVIIILGILTIPFL